MIERWLRLGPSIAAGWAAVLSVVVEGIRRVLGFDPHVSASFHGALPRIVVEGRGWPRAQILGIGIHDEPYADANGNLGAQDRALGIVTTDGDGYFYLEATFDVIHKTEEIEAARHTFPDPHCTAKGRLFERASDPFFKGRYFGFVP